MLRARGCLAKSPSTFRLKIVEIPNVHKSVVASERPCAPTFMAKASSKFSLMFLGKLRVNSDNFAASRPFAPTYRSTRGPSRSS